MSTEKVAIPADIPNGLDSPVSNHFGQCRVFIVSTIDNGAVVEVETLVNGPHSSCAEPVEALAANGVTVLLANGMGRRPYMVCQQLGISVVKAQGATVGDAVQHYIAGSSSGMAEDVLCKGGEGHHDH